MRALVLGGTRFVGVHLVETLLAGGHDVTVATRGVTRDPFGDRVTRAKIDRRDGASLRAALRGQRFDVAYDNLCYCSEDMQVLLDVLNADRYAMTSTASVYPQWRAGLTEPDFEPAGHTLTWCMREMFPYDEVKRQAECAVVQAYPGVESVMMRIPFVIGPDDYTQRLYFYVERMRMGLPMWVDNWDVSLCCVDSQEAGRFLTWLGMSTVRGPVNGCSRGTFTLRQVTDYVQRKTGWQVLEAEDGAPGPYNGCPSFSLDVSKAEAAGYGFTQVDDWLEPLLDQYIARAEKMGR